VAEDPDGAKDIGEDRCQKVIPCKEPRHVASAFRELGGSGVRAARNCIKSREVARREITTSIDLCVGPRERVEDRCQEIKRSRNSGPREVKG
jgi:hypothetical protein